jgi:hypothetical protein
VPARGTGSTGGLARRHGRILFGGGFTARYMNPDGTGVTEAPTRNDPQASGPWCSTCRSETERVYRISFTASDGMDQCSGVATVEVRRKKNRPAVDSAPPSYDSFGP